MRRLRDVAVQNQSRMQRPPPMLPCRGTQVHDGAQRESRRACLRRFSAERCFCLRVWPDDLMRAFLTFAAAFFWGVPVDPETDWSSAIDDVYQETAPQFANPDKRFTAEWLIGIATENFKASGCFGKITTKQYFWSETLTGEQYIKGLWTFSMHQGIDEEMREKLYARILKVIERFGGQVTQPRSAMLFHSKVKR